MQALIEPPPAWIVIVDVHLPTRSVILRSRFMRERRTGRLRHGDGDTDPRGILDLRIRDVGFRSRTSPGRNRHA